VVQVQYKATGVVHVYNGYRRSTVLQESYRCNAEIHG